MSIYIDGDIRPGASGFRRIIVMGDGTVTDIQGEPIGKAIQLPPHGRLIDADAFRREINNEIVEHRLNGLKGTTVYTSDLEAMYERLSNEDLTPTIIPADGGANNG